MTTKADRYWLRIFDKEWQEVTKEQFIEAELQAGFHSSHGPGTIATAGFGTNVLDGQIDPEKPAM
jgi:hypothetical protein